MKIMRNLEKNTAKDLKKYIYHWYLSGKGTHEENLECLFKNIEKIVLPPMTEKLKTSITTYIENRNKTFERLIIKKLESW